MQIWGLDGTQIFRSTRSALPPRAVLGFSDVEAHGNRYRVYTLQTALQTVQIAQDLDARSARARAGGARRDAFCAADAAADAGRLVGHQPLAGAHRTRQAPGGRPPAPTTCRRWPPRACPTRCARWWTNSTCCSAACAAPSRRKNILWPMPRTSCARRSRRSSCRPQALRRNGDTPAEREAGIARLNQGIDRAIRLVEQLLVLARERSRRGGGRGRARGPAGGRQARGGRRAARMPCTSRSTWAWWRATRPCRRRRSPARPTPCASLLRNLLDNAVKYTPAGGRVDVSLAAAGRPQRAVGGRQRPRHRRRRPRTRVRPLLPRGRRRGPRRRGAANRQRPGPGHRQGDRRAARRHAWRWAARSAWAGSGWMCGFPADAGSRRCLSRALRLRPP